MTPVLTIIEEFLPYERFTEIRALVQQDGFRTVEIQEQVGTQAPKVPYQNVNVSLKFPDFKEGLEKFFGAKIDVHMDAFRNGFRGSQLHNKVHADHCCSNLASVYFMNDLRDCQGGTAFWRHKKHGWEYMPTQEQLDQADYTLPELEADWHNEDAWQIISLAGMRPNRIIIYPSQAFHSRYPFDGLGEGFSSRLVHVSFFDLL